MPASNLTAGIPRLFRTYKVPKNQSFDCTIWEAARATTASPTFFKGIEIGRHGSKERFIDGGVGRNNPIAQVFEEAELVFPGRLVACAISIGTGQAKTIAIPKPSPLQRMLPSDVVNAVIQIAGDCERTAEEISRRFKSRANFHFRFNVEQGLQQITLAQWDRLGEVTTHTKQYMLKSEVDQKIDAVIKAIQGQCGLVPTTHLTQNHFDDGFKNDLLKGSTVGVTPRKSQPYSKACPPPTNIFTGRADILTQMKECFCNTLTSVGKRRIFVLYGLGGAGKSQCAYKFVEECQATLPHR